MERALQGAHGSGDGAVRIRAAGGHGAADEGGVVAAAVLRVDHQHHIQQVGLLLGVVGIGPDHPQEVLRSGQVLHGEMDVQRVALEVVPLDGISVGYNAGKGSDELHRLEQDVVQRGVVGVLVVGVQRQHAAGQLVHDVPAGVLHDHVFRKAVGQLSCAVHDLVEAVQLTVGGQIAHEQQVGDLFIAKGPGLAVGLDDLRKLNAAVIQLAGDGDPHAVFDHVAQNGADAGHADGHAGAVGVSQTQLQVTSVIFGRDTVFGLDVLAEGTCILFQDPVSILILHRMVPLSPKFAPGRPSFAWAQWVQKMFLFL